MHYLDARLRKLDDAAMVQYHLDAARQLGRIEGIAYQMQMDNFARGFSPEKPKFERTYQWRHMKHLEHEYRRTLRVMYGRTK